MARLTIGQYVEPPGFPLVVSGNSRYMRTALGVPYLINVSNASWDMIQAISLADFKTFADAEKARGFNTLLLSAISNDTERFPSDSGNHFAAPNWKTTGGTSVPPFTTPGNFSTFNSAYIAHLQACIDYMASIAMLAMVVNAYIGYGGAAYLPAQGFAKLLEDDTDAHVTTYGNDLATALTGRDNVIMIAGGDLHPAASSTIQSRMLASIAGFKAVDDTRLWGGHGGGDTFGDASDATLGGDLSYDIPGLETAVGSSKLLYTHYAYNQSGKRARRRIRDGYQRSPTRPTLVLDPSYENDTFTSSRLELRSRTYETMCEGSCSMAYARGGDAASGGWVFLATRNGTSATQDHQYAKVFWDAVPWYTMAPDGAGTFVTSGRGADSNTADDYVSVLASTGCLVLYFPSGSNRTATVDMSQLTGGGFFSVPGVRRGRWYDPTSGIYYAISTSLSTSGTRTFGFAGTHAFPDIDGDGGRNNAAGNTDWVLVID